MEQEKYFTVKEVALHLRLTEKFVRAEIGRKRLLANKMGGEFRISETDLIAYKKLTHTGNGAEDLIEIGA